MKKITKDYLNYFCDEAQFAIVAISNRHEKHPKIAIRRCSIAGQHVRMLETIVYDDIYRYSVQIYNALMQYDFVIAECESDMRFLYCEECFDSQYMVLKDFAESVLPKDFWLERESNEYVSIYDLFYIIDDKYLPLFDITHVAAVATDTLLYYANNCKKYPVRTTKTEYLNHLLALLQHQDTLASFNTYDIEDPANEVYLLARYFENRNDIDRIRMDEKDPEKLSAFFDSYKNVKALIGFECEQMAEVIKGFFERNKQPFDIEIIDLSRVAEELFGKPHNFNKRELLQRFLLFYDYLPDFYFEDITMDMCTCFVRMMQDYAKKTQGGT